MAPRAVKEKEPHCSPDVISKTAWERCKANYKEYCYILLTNMWQSQKPNRRVERNKRRQMAKLGFEPREDNLSVRVSAYATQPVITLSCFKELYNILIIRNNPSLNGAKLYSIYLVLKMDQSIGVIVSPRQCRVANKPLSSLHVGDIAIPLLKGMSCLSCLQPITYDKKIE